MIALAIAAAAAGAAVVVNPPVLPGSPPPVLCGADAAQITALDGMAQYAQWLRRNDVAGYVGEVGWPATGPDADRWQDLAEVWYSAADAAGLPVTAWAAARWPSTYAMGVYTAEAGTTSLGARGPQASVVEAHPTDDRLLRGVVVAGGSFGRTSSSGGDPGRYGYDYSYENASGYAYLARRGVRLVRLALVWERLQPVPGGPLDETELLRVRRAVGQAQRAGLVVILDLHGYGQFLTTGKHGEPRRLTLGTRQLPAARLADLWSRLATATLDLPGILGYDLLNEPLRLAKRGDAGARLWEDVSQQAVDAIRASGSPLPVFVAGYGQTAPGRWDEVHPRAWISDPVGRTVYETHVYFDSDNSGHYDAGYAAQEAADRAQVARSHTPRCRTLPDLTTRQEAAIGSPRALVSPADGSLLGSVLLGSVLAPVGRLVKGGS